MSSDVTIDAGELTAFGRRVAAAHAMAGVSIAKAVKKGAQVVKEKTQSDLNSSSNGGLHVVRVRYELGTTGSQIYADIGPEDSGKTREHGHTGPTVAAIAFYGTARGGGTHKPPRALRRRRVAHARRIRGRRRRRHVDRSHRIMSVMDMTSAVLGMIPGLDQPVYLNQEPDESEMPPWVIATCTTDGHRSTEAARYTAHVGRLEIRVVDLTADAVNVICDDRIIPAMKYRVPAKTSGFTVGQLILDADSGAYAAGLTADDTSRRYQVRVLRFRFTWTRP